VVTREDLMKINETVRVLHSSEARCLSFVNGSHLGRTSQLSRTQQKRTCQTKNTDEVHDWKRRMNPRSLARPCCGGGGTGMMGDGGSGGKVSGLLAV
jgi:hypothetical protein